MSGPGAPSQSEQHVVSTPDTEVDWVLEHFNVCIDDRNELFDNHSPVVSDQVLVGRLLEDSAPYASRFITYEAISECRGRFLSHFKDELADPSVQEQGEFVGVFDCDSVIGEAVRATSWRDDIPEPQVIKCTQVTFSLSWDADEQHWVELTGFASSPPDTIDGTREQRLLLESTVSSIRSAEQHLAKWAHPTAATLACNEDGVAAISGWSKQLVVEGFYQGTNDVLAFAKQAKYTFPRHGRDKGVPGRYHACHAEAQLSVLTTGSISVSNPMCLSCQDWFSFLAQLLDMKRIVTDPESIRVFHPNGDIDEIDKENILK